MRKIFFSAIATPGKSMPVAASNHMIFPTLLAILIRLFISLPPFLMTQFRL
jgi:hypothetical protein